MKRVWHHFEKWEELAAGMWSDVTSAERAELLPKAVEFTGDHTLYGSFMLRVIAEWPISCEHNLTDVHQNRKAWVGHAACCLAIKCPEHITRQAWGMLSRQQQDDANERAQEAVEKWEISYAEENRKLYSEMAKKRLREWNPGRSAAATGAGMQGAIVQSHLSRDIDERRELVQPWLFPLEV